MAQKVQVLLVDDLDGGEAGETVSFSLDGVGYEIDLNAKNAARLREEKAPWVGHARRVGGRRSTGGRGRSGGSSGTDTAAVREWAREHGYKVSERGRISAEVMEAYKAAH
jgi:hypothetical protein